MKKTEKAILAGGCFWGMEELFRKLPGVIKTRVGYAGGTTANPSYERMGGHAESLEVIYDPAVTNYRKLLEFFFQIHNPTTPNQQGNDRGSQYRSLIICEDENQQQIAQKLIAEIEASKKWPSKIVTEIKLGGEFYEAEKYHQNYLENNPGGYTCHYVRPAWKL